jgi:YrhK-like protein
VSVAGALRIGRAEPGPSRRIGRLFMAGSFCFAIASVPVFADIGRNPAAATYFVGSVFFTAAAAEQLRTTADGDRLDLVASAVQLAGTIFFNLSTFGALDDRLDERSVDFLVWLPNAAGSVCFLVASGIALAAVRRLADRRALPIAALNTLGSVAFGVSAVAALVIPASHAPVNSAAAAAFTLVGAVCFFVAAYLLVPREAPAA